MHNTTEERLGRLEERMEDVEARMDKTSSRLDQILHMTLMLLGGIVANLVATLISK